MPDADVTAEAEAQFFCPAYDRRFVGRTCADRWRRANPDDGSPPRDFTGSNTMRAEAATEAARGDEPEAPPRLFWCRDCPAGEDRAAVLKLVDVDDAVEAAAQEIGATLMEDVCKRCDQQGRHMARSPFAFYCFTCFNNARTKARRDGDASDEGILAKLTLPYEAPMYPRSRTTTATKPATTATAPKKPRPRALDALADALDALVDPPQPAIEPAAIGHVQGPALSADPPPAGQDARSGETSAHLGPATHQTTTATETAAEPEAHLTADDHIRAAIALLVEEALAAEAEVDRWTAEAARRWAKAGRVADAFAAVDLPDLPG